MFYYYNFNINILLLENFTKKIFYFQTSDKITFHFHISFIFNGRSYGLFISNFVFIKNDVLPTNPFTADVSHDIIKINSRINFTFSQLSVKMITARRTQIGLILHYIKPR